MLLERRSVVQVYEGQLSGVQSDDTKILDMSDAKRKQVIVAAFSAGGGQIAKSGTLTIPLPDGYTNASYLQVTIIVEDTCKVVTTSPDHADSTTLVNGDSTTPGIHQITEHINTIQIVNYDSTNAVRVNYCAVTLPDISDEENFRGLESDGTWNTTS